MVERPWDPPRYEHKSGMLIPRYANIGQDCGSAEHGTIRRHQSPGFCPRHHNTCWEKYGMNGIDERIKSMAQIYDLLIIGSGPAGMAAAIYAQRAGLKAAVLEKTGISGGQVLTTYEVDNYPGLPEISGFDLSEKFKEHALHLGTEIQTAEVKKVIDQGTTKVLETDQGCLEARTVLIATGAHHAKLHIPGEEELAGMGVSYCATCDGAFFRNRTAVVVGGGDVAVEDAIFLARFCKKVYLVHRRDSLRAAKLLQEHMLSLSNVEVIWNAEVTEIAGEEQVEQVTLFYNKENREEVLPVDGVFIAVGTIPDTAFVKGLAGQDEKGYLIAGEDCRTSVKGIYAAGDVRTKALRQILTAAADGANAVTSVQEDLLTL